MKLLCLFFALLIASVAFSSDIVVSVSVITATDSNAKVKVAVTNNATPTNLSVVATVNYQRWGFDEEVSSTPLTISILHPVEVKGINLSFPGDWVCLTPFSPVTLTDGQNYETTLEYSKVSVKL